MSSKLFCTYLYLTILFTSWFHFIQAKSIPSNETDLLPLIAFRDQIEGLSSWNQAFHFCQWEGITCGKRHLRVVELNLSNQGFVGSITPFIGNLTFLTVIDLGDNRFYGEVPQEIGRLQRLEYINLGGNSFQGSIPVNLSQCTQLRVLSLAQNKLSGNIPPQLESLSKLSYLSLYANNLTGPIPLSFGNLSSLKQFSQGQNFLEGSIPYSFERLSKLTFFNVEINRLSGHIPSFIFNVSSMITFAISMNQFSGSLPPNMGITLPNLQDFFVGGNRFSGPLPVSLANASKIQMLEIRDNNFTGNLPSQFGTLQNLVMLNLGNNHLGKAKNDDLSFITSLVNSTNLRSLSLDKNNFRGVIPNSISNLSTQMEKLYLGTNQIHGIIPQDIGNLVNLIALGLEDNYFRGSIPSSIGNIQKLQRLILWGNRLTGFIPSSLANATQLSNLFLQENELVGNIPLSFAHYQYLQVLFVARNNLNGMIPKEIFNISSLSVALDLSHNSFTGSLPVEVGNLIHLEGIDVSGNKLSGKIPSTLASCLSLQELYLENNLFEGSIPQSLSSLKGLQYIDLSRNNLSGSIPVYFEKFQYLERLNLSFNELEGEVPTKGIFGNASIIFAAGNSKLCGGIRELQLQACESKSTKKQGSPVTLKLVIAICVPTVFLLACLLLILYLKRKPKARISLTSLKDRFYTVSYGDLFQATNGFSPTNLLGSGGFGRVYKGTLRQDEVVAVKVFNLQQKGASKSFVDECESMRSIRHRNLLTILTACSSMDYEGNEFKALVFEFMPNGSLEKWLYGDTDEDIDQKNKLSLHQRLNIVVDVAYALNYLHHESHVSVIHRDLKPSNVLLDNDMVAHVSDFGLAKLLSGSPLAELSETQSTSVLVKGSIGYAAPEYGMGGEASTLGDVYSYGILLLELFTGRRPTDAMFIDGLNLHKFCKTALPDEVIEVVDPVLASTEELLGMDMEKASQIMDSESQNPLGCIASVLRIGVACSSEVPGERMNMGEVAKELQFLRNKTLAFL